jgi:hypothetical protein
MRTFAKLLWVTSSMLSFRSLHCAALRHGQPGLGAVSPTSSAAIAQRATDYTEYNTHHYSMIGINSPYLVMLAAATELVAFIIGYLYGRVRLIGSRLCIPPSTPELTMWSQIHPHTPVGFTRAIPSKLIHTQN